MKRLLVIQDHWLSAAFRLDLRRRRQQFRLLLRSSMAVLAHGHWRRIRIFLEEIRSQGGGSIRRPRSLVQRVLYHFRCWLRRMMTLDARDRLGPVDTAILGDVVDVAKLYGA